MLENVYLILFSLIMMVKIKLMGKKLILMIKIKIKRKKLERNCGLFIPRK